GSGLRRKQEKAQWRVGEADIRGLKVGDVVLISGEMYTGRDAVHSYLMKHDPPVSLQGSVLYHCGPVVMKNNGSYKITAAGPTTSIREEPYQGEIIKRYGVRAVMGKGGMGKRTLDAMKEAGAVYLNAIGGAAQYYARCIDEVLGVGLMEFGIPEAIWHLRGHDFPAIVTMGAHGNLLHADVEKASAIMLEKRAPSVFFEVPLLECQFGSGTERAARKIFPASLPDISTCRGTASHRSRSRIAPRMQGTFALQGASARPERQVNNLAYGAETEHRHLRVDGLHLAAN